MKVLFIMDSGIPEYRDFLFEAINESNDVSEFLVVHSGTFYSKRTSSYPAKPMRFVGSNKFGFHLQLASVIKQFDLIFSSYNIRIISCWLPMFVFPNKKWVFWGKGLGQKNGWVVKRIRKIVANSAHKVLVYNSHTRSNLLNELKIDENKVEAFGNTLMISNPGYNPNVKLTHFLYFGRLQKRKGLKELIESYHIFKNKNPETSINLRIVGSGEYKSELLLTVKKLALENRVEFFEGVYSDSEIKKHFENAVAYVSPQNVGLAIVNSFAYGVPVITAKGSQAAPEFFLLDETNSIVLENISELPSALDMITEPMLLKSLRSSCYNFYIDQLSHERMTSTFLNAIKKVKNHIQATNNNK